MPDCDHCGESFDDEETLLSHLGEEHYDDLGPIDRRRVDQHRGEDDGLPLAALALGGVLVVAAALVAYFFFVAGGNGGDGYTVRGIEVAQTPTGQPYQGTHIHGDIEMVVGGERVDFGRSEYQVQADAFHFESGDGTRWHVHAPGVTLEYGLATLGIEVSADAVTVDDTTYRDGENATVTVTVNGEGVDPASYVLRDGDSVRVVVETQ